MRTRACSSCPSPWLCTDYISHRRAYLSVRCNQMSANCHNSCTNAMCQNLVSFCTYVFHLLSWLVAMALAIINYLGGFCKFGQEGERD